jgi:hypothetical protein
MVTTTGLFDSFSNVVRAVDILRGCGFGRDEISVVAHKDETDEMSSHAAARPNHTIDKQSLILPTDLSTFVVDERSLFVRGVGWVAAAGPLALILVETMDETQSGDLIDALIAFDVSDEEAEYYAEGVRRGGTLLAVTAANHLAERAEDVLLLHGAVDTHQRVMRWRQQGWNNFSLTSAPYRVTDIERGGDGKQKSAYLVGTGLPTTKISGVTFILFIRTVSYHSSIMLPRIAMAINSLAIRAMTRRIGTKSKPKPTKLGRDSTTPYGEK